jgi:hypothetical protein
MGTPKKILRGLQDIPTISGRVDQAFSPHKVYMKVSCLEMEKFRRGQERENAIQRVKNIDRRFKEIEAEEAALLEALKEENFGNHVHAPSVEPKPAFRRNNGGFKLRY